MKANEAPEKIYLSDFTDTTESVFYVKQDNTKETDIEYTRTDAFIEKVARFLEYKLNDRVEIRVAGTLIPSLTDKRTFIEDFKKYMKGK